MPKKNKRDRRRMVARVRNCGTWVFARGEYTSPCRRLASYRRSAAGMRTKRCDGVATLGENQQVTMPKKQKRPSKESLFCLAAEPGFEPRTTESEAGMLPLHHSAIAFTPVYSITTICVCQVFFESFLHCFKKADMMADFVGVCGLFC